MKSTLHRWTGSVGLLALLMVVGPGVREASAANCGGSTACKCGDTVTRSTTLAKDIGVCTGTGLKVISGVTLDCAKRTITGSMLSPAKYGVLVDGAKGATVKNCRVTGFGKGIRLAGGRENQISGNEIFTNRDYGIELARRQRGERDRPQQLVEQPG